MELDLYQYLKALQRYWWLIVAMVMLAVGAGVSYSSSQTSIYETKIAFLASPNLAITDVGDLINGLGTIVRNSGIMVTSCEILESETIRMQAAQTLGVPLDVVNDYDVDCVLLPDTTVLQMRVRGESPELAADLANAIGSTGVVYINDLYEIVKVIILDSAKVNDDPISPNHVVNIVMSAAIGFVGALAFIVLRETLVQLFGSSDKQDKGDLILQGEGGLMEHVALALMTLNPQTQGQDVKQTRAQKADVQKYLARQIQEFLQQNSRPSDIFLYLENKKFALLMPHTSRLEAEDVVIELGALLRVKTFTVPDTDILVTYTAAVGIVENEDNLLQWNKMLAACQDVEQEMRVVADVAVVAA